MKRRTRTTIAAASLAAAALPLAAAGPAAAEPPPTVLTVTCEGNRWVLNVRGTPVAQLRGHCADGASFSWGASNSGGTN